MSATDALPTLLAQAEELRGVAESLGLPELASAIANDTTRRLEHARLRAVVLGEIKQGKTTLINALLGQDALPTGVTPVTGAVVVVRSGSAQGRYRIVGADRHAVDRSTFETLARGPKKGEPDEPGTLELVVEGGQLPPSLELVDTPGVNDIARFRGALSRGELPRADVLVLVLDATQLLSRTELAFLRDAIAAVGGLEGSGASLLVVINRIDLVDEPERPKLVEYLRKELAGLGRGELEVFQTDARTALRDPESDNPGVVDVARLRARLDALADGRDAVLPARARAGLLRHTRLLAHNAAIAARAMTLERQTLRREIAAIQRELAAQRADTEEIRGTLQKGRQSLIGQSAGRVAKFREQLQASVLAAVTVANLRMLSSHLPGSIHDAFLAFARQESDRLRAALDDMTRDALHTHGEQARRRLVRATMGLGFRGPTIYLDPPSVTLEAGLVAVGVAGTAIMYFGNLVAGLVMTVAGPLATVALREKSLRNAREQARAELPDALEKAASALDETVSKVVSDHILSVEEHLLLADVSLGGQLIAVLEKAADRLGDDFDSEDTAKATRTVAQEENRRLELKLAEIRTHLEALPLGE